MLTVYDPFEQNLKIPEWPEEELEFTTLDLAENLQLSEELLQEAVGRAISACSLLNMPVSGNFRRKFFSDGNGVHAFWDLSPFACYLTLINYPPVNTGIARAQIFFAEKLFTHGNSNQRG